MWALLWKNKGLCAVAALALLATVQYALNARLHEQLADEQAAVRQLEAANRAFKLSVDEQNAAIFKLKLDGERRQRAVAKALQAAASAVKAHRQYAQELERAQPVGDECAAARALLAGYMERVRR